MPGCCVGLLSSCDAGAHGCDAIGLQLFGTWCGAGCRLTDERFGCVVACDATCVFEIGFEIAERWNAEFLECGVIASYGIGGVIELAVSDPA